jgi:glycosyltransferase involved in cell wall biosynthesis
LLTRAALKHAEPRTAESGRRAAGKVCIYETGGLLTNRKILLISYLFPPVGGIGVQRALSLAKYLPASGFEVHVLKATNAGGPVYDPDLIRQVPHEVQVHKAFTPEIPFHLRQKLWARLTGGANPAGPGSNGRPRGGFSWKKLVTGTARRILSPEPEILWAPFALRKARSIVRRHGIDSVMVTVPPFSALVVGTRLKREFPSLVLVSDFRDEWLSFYLKDFDFQSSEYTRRRAETIEREAVEASDLVVAVNRSSRDEIRNRYAGEPDGKFAVVPNGYDPEVFAGFAARKQESGRMIVTHVGTVYKTASPRFFLDAVDSLPEEIRGRIETRFVGRVAESERPLLEGRASRVTTLGFMPQAEALKYLEDTDYLLLTMTNDISVPGKLFEYMASGKPMLAIAAPGSEVDQILRETGAGVAAPPGDVGAIRAMLLRAFEAWRGGARLAGGDPESVRRYERPRLVAEYGTLMRGVEARPK